MCVLVYVPDVVHFPSHYLALMLRDNPDGAGIAWFDRKLGVARVRRFLTVMDPEPMVPEGFGPLNEDRLGKLNMWRVKRGEPALGPRDLLTCDDVSPEYLAWLHGGNLMRKHDARRIRPAKRVTFVDQGAVERAIAIIPPGSPLIFHARIATHGGICTANTHPFRVPRSKAIIAHNGTIGGMGASRWGKWGEDAPGGADDMSDTRELAEVHLAGMSYRQIRKARGLIEHVGGSSKFAVMCGDTGEVTLIGRFGGSDANGVQYSNLAFLPPEPGKVGKVGK